MSDIVNKPQEARLLVDTVSYFNIGKDYTDTQVKKNDGRVYLVGIMQRAEVPNQNGRIYTKESMEREIDRLLPLVKDNQLLGQLDHPECLQEDAFVMTKTGWKQITELSDDEEIFTLNRETRKIELQQISRKIDQSYTGKMIHIKNRNIDLCVTPDHRFVIYREMPGKSGKNYIKSKFVYAKDLATIDGHWYIPRIGEWEGLNEEFFTLPAWEGAYGNQFEHTVFPEVKINMKDWLAFFGLWLAEGHVAGSNNNGVSTNGYKVGVSQVKSANIQPIQDLLDRLPFKFGHSGNVWYCNDVRLWTYLSKFGNSSTKYIPVEIKQLSKELLSILFEWMMLGDGRKRSVQQVRNNGDIKLYTASKYNTISEKLINDVQEILFKMGIASNLHMQEQNDRYIGERLIKKENSQPLFDLHISTTKRIYLKTLKIMEEDFSGRVYCVTVPNEVFYVKQNGYSCWTGNSSTVEFDDACIKIVDLWWEGYDVMGKVQVIKGHPSGDKLLALLENEVKIGISSRALGTTMPASSTEKYSHYGDVEVVGDDLKLITWDIVTNPSTHGAFMVTEQLMTESINNRANVDFVSYIPSILDNKLMYFLNNYSERN